MIAPARSHSSGWLGEAERRRFAARHEEAERRARRTGKGVLLSLTVPADPALDPTAVIATGRRAGEPWFCLEEPDRDGMALAALGAADELRADGGERFTSISAQWRTRVQSSVADPPAATPGAGLVALGGLAFAAAGAATPTWRDFGPGSLLVPAVSLARHAGAVWLTVNRLVSAGTRAGDSLAAVEERLAGLTASRLPMVDPEPVGRFTIRSLMPPVHYEEAVARAIERIVRGEVQKVVLAREVEVTAPGPYEPAGLLAILREAFPSCFVFAVGRGEATFVGASPELLMRREGARVATVALAGSARRSADPAVDDHLGEQLLRSTKDRAENAIVARRIERALAPHALWVTAAPEPALIRVANIQHLGAPIRAQLRRPLDAVQLAGLLHPTPAVGGEPWSVAEPLIPALEGFDRGWYAGPIGWVDSAGDGEFCVALRCGLVRGANARLFAGAGIVADSDPAAELAETEVKLGALLPILAG